MKYTFTTEWDEEEKEFIGKCEQFPSLSVFCEKESEAMKEILEVTAMSIEWMIEEGESIPGGRG